MGVPNIKASMIQEGIWSTPYAMVSDGFRDFEYNITMVNPSNVISLPRHFVKDKVFIVPGGMGDIAWVYAKLCSLTEPFIFAVAGDTQGRAQWTISLRSIPFIDLLEKVKYTTVATCSSDQVCWSSFLTDCTNGRLPSSPTFMSCNRWLETGRKLDDFFPSQKTVRRFKMKRPRWAMKESTLFLGNGDKAFAVYTSSVNYFCNQNLSVYEWVCLIKAIHSLDYDRKIVLIGAPWDLTMLVPVYDALCSVGLKDSLILMHDRNIAVTMEVLRKCDFLVGAVCGITIVAEYQGIPTVHLYPKTHLSDFVIQESSTKTWKGSRLLGTWESPDMVEEGTSLSLRIPDGDKKIFESMRRSFSPLGKLR